MKIRIYKLWIRRQGTKDVLLNRLQKPIQDMNTRNIESESRKKANEKEKGKKHFKCKWC